MNYEQPDAEVGDTIKLVTGSDDPSGRVHYNAGDTATLVKLDEDGDWWANFNNQGNDTVYGNGIKCLQQSAGVDEGRFEVIIDGGVE